MTLETKRLTLRPWREADAEDLYRLACDSEVGPSAGWLPHTSVEHSREIIRTMLSKPTVWAVCEKAGHPIGNIHFDFDTPLREHDGECELGYWLGKPFWGQGLMTEAARGLLRYAFDVLDVPAVWSGYYEENIKSRRVQEKLGFIQRRTEEIPCISKEMKTVHRTYLTREIWEERYEPSSI